MLLVKYGAILFSDTFESRSATVMHYVGCCTQTAELDALESLTSPSSVQKEKAQLAMMKAALQESLGQVGFSGNACYLFRKPLQKEQGIS